MAKYGHKLTLWKLNCANAQTGVEQDNGYITSQWLGTWSKVITGPYRIIMSICGERVGVEWTSGSSAHDWRFRPKCRIIQKLHNSLGRPTYWCLNYKESIAFNVKLWPSSNINWWPSYRVTTMYIITLCRFRITVVNLQGWPTSHVLLNWTKHVDFLVNYLMWPRSVAKENVTRI
jgi:hypothetical protein